MSPRIPSLPKLFKDKLYKTGQTRGADDDVIFQNRVNRNNTVLIPFDYYEKCSVAPDNNGAFENGFIVLIKPEDYFNNREVKKTMEGAGLVLGVNSLLFYETRNQWDSFDPIKYGFQPALSRTAPLGGQYVARVPSTTAASDQKINYGFNSSGLKGAGIRVYEYASSDRMYLCQLQLEYLYWLCFDSIEISIFCGMTPEGIKIRKDSNLELCKTKGLSNIDTLKDMRMIDNDLNTVCPLCLEKLSAIGFYNRLEQAEGRYVPDLTVTQLNLFHIRELKTGEFNHKPYNLGWGHHHCNIVCKDSGIISTLRWMKDVLERNNTNGISY